VGDISAEDNPLVRYADPALVSFVFFFFFSSWARLRRAPLLFSFVVFFERLHLTFVFITRSQSRRAHRARFDACNPRLTVVIVRGLDGRVVLAEDRCG